MRKVTSNEQSTELASLDLDHGNLAVDMDQAEHDQIHCKRLALIQEQASAKLAQADETPRGRLRAAVSGQGQVNREDVEALLADHMLESEGQVKELGKTCKELTEFLFSGAKQDPVATLKLVTQLTNLHKSHAEEMRRTIELLTRIQRPRSPQIQVIAVDNDQLNIGDKQIIGRTVDLGGRGRR